VRILLVSCSLTQLCGCYPVYHCSRLLEYIHGILSQRRVRATTCPVGFLTFSISSPFRVTSSGVSFFIFVYHEKSEPPRLRLPRHNARETKGLLTFTWASERRTAVALPGADMAGADAPAPETPLPGQNYALARGLPALCVAPRLVRTPSCRPPSYPRPHAFRHTRRREGRSTVLPHTSSRAAAARLTWRAGESEPMTERNQRAE
jgi:hypothetical protein